MAITLELIRFDPNGETESSSEIMAWNVRNEEEKGIYIQLDDNEDGISSGIHVTKKQLEELGYIEA